MANLLPCQSLESCQVKTPCLIKRWLIERCSCYKYPFMQREAVLHSSAVMNRIYMHTPDAALTEHDCDTLSLMGSLQQLGSGRVQQLMNSTNLNSHQYVSQLHLEFTQGIMSVWLHALCLPDMHMHKAVVVCLLAPMGS